MIFKALRGETPDYLLDLFVPSHNDVYQLRSNDRKLYMKKPIQTSWKKLFILRNVILE